MSKVFVSGCYDILHAGHIQFLKEAKTLGEELIVCVPSDEVLFLCKNRRPSIPLDHKIEILKNLPFVDDVVVGSNIEDIGLNFKDIIKDISPDILVATEDDDFWFQKENLCEKIGVEYRILPKTSPEFEPVSTSSIIDNILAPQEVPMRVDLAGGWLDVPEHARCDGFVVNCAISPNVSLTNWMYEKQSGLGGSAAWAHLNGKDAVESELNMGVGWQDAAIIRETGLCAWKSDDRPHLSIKRSGDILKGKMALWHTGNSHNTPAYSNLVRDYDLLAAASRTAMLGVQNNDLGMLCDAINLNYNVQIKEGMAPLPDIGAPLARKYCGGGHGGYALYVFSDLSFRDDFISSTVNTIKIEPYINYE